MKTDPAFRRKRRVISNAGYYLMHADVLKIIDACTQVRDRVLIETLAFTGIRRAEVAGLTVDDILWKKGLLHIRHGKGDKQRFVPLPTKLLNGFREILGSRPTGFIFESKKGGSLSLRQINRIVAKAGQRAQVENPNPKYKNITCHLFRHTFARLWKAKQGSIESLSVIMGHQSVRTTWDVYGRESIEDIRENYNQTIKKMFGE
ncbi:MAG: site-specific integrase [Candidatus Zixiibacteriota bacterium]